MSTAHAGSPAGVPSSHTVPSPHCFIETSGEINDFMKMHITNLAKCDLRQSENVSQEPGSPPVACHQDHLVACQPRSTCDPMLFSPPSTREDRRVCLGREYRGVAFRGRVRGLPRGRQRDAGDLGGGWCWQGAWDCQGVVDGEELFVGAEKGIVYFGIDRGEM